MKAPAFDYVRAHSVEEALAILTEHGDAAKIIAGGQSLVPALNMRLLAPELLVDISKIDDLRGISVQDGRVKIGALTRHVDLQRSDEIRRHAPLLSQAIDHVGHAAVRNRGTIGGSIANADPASELPACIVALQATVTIAGPDGTRAVAADDFFTGLYETALGLDEILTAIEFDTIGSDGRSAFAELTRRHGDYALVGVAAHGHLRSGIFDDLRLVYFSIGQKPTLAQTASSRLIGQPLEPDTVAAAQDALTSDLDPPDDVQASSALRLRLARVLLGRIVADLLQTAQTD